MLSEQTGVPPRAKGFKGKIGVFLSPGEEYLQLLPSTFGFRGLIYSNRTGRYDLGPPGSFVFVQ